MLKISNKPFVNYVNVSLFGLPTSVGKFESGSIKTTSKPGYLIFGPYANLPKGKYNLTIFGESSFAGGSFVDIISDRGLKTYEKLEIPSNKKGVLIQNAPILIDENVQDMEIRIWVNTDNVITLSGYKLE
jgi:hypothetical protein